MNPYLEEGPISWDDNARGRLFYRDRDHQRAQFVAVAQRLPELNGLTLLDYGCGYADFAKGLPPDCTYIGTEANRSVVEVARQNNPGLDIRHTRRVFPADVIVAIATVQCGVANPEWMVRLFHRYARLLTVFTVWQHFVEVDELVGWCPGRVEVFPSGGGGSQDFLTVVMKP